MDITDTDLKGHHSRVMWSEFKFGTNFYFVQGQMQLSGRSATHHQHIPGEI